MIISVANQKGGVGKTTTTQALFSGLIVKNFRVLAIDLDPQSNMSTALGADITTQSIYEVLMNKFKITESIQTLKLGGDIIPSNILLAGAEIELNQKMKREELLISHLRQIQHLYDFILIDTPPALGILTINAFSASDKIIIPMGADIFSLQGLGQLSNTIQEVKKFCNPNLSVEGILLTKYNSRTILSKELTDVVYNSAKQLNTKVYQSKIRASVSIQEAQTQSSDILTYANSNAQIDYKQFIEEFLIGLKK